MTSGNLMANQSNFDKSVSNMRARNAQKVSDARQAKRDMYVSKVQELYPDDPVATVKAIQKAYSPALKATDNSGKAYLESIGSSLPTQDELNIISEGTRMPTTSEVLGGVPDDIPYQLVEELPQPVQVDARPFGGRTWAQAAGDTALSLEQGVINLFDIGTTVVDAFTTTPVNNVLRLKDRLQKDGLPGLGDYITKDFRVIDNGLGDFLKLDEASKFVDTFKSDSYQYDKRTAEQDYASQTTIGGKAKSVVDNYMLNPTLGVDLAAKSLPQMFAGGWIGRVAKGIPTGLRAVVGEGAITSLGDLTEVRNAKGNVGYKDAGLSIVDGVTTGYLAKRLGGNSIFSPEALISGTSTGMKRNVTEHALDLALQPVQEFAQGTTSSVYTQGMELPGDNRDFSDYIPDGLKEASAAIYTSGPAAIPLGATIAAKGAMAGTDYAVKTYQDKFDNPDVWMDKSQKNFNPNKGFTHYAQQYNNAQTVEERDAAKVQMDNAIDLALQRYDELDQAYQAETDPKKKVELGKQLEKFKTKQLAPLNSVVALQEQNQNVISDLLVDATLSHDQQLTQNLEYDSSLPADEQQAPVTSTNGSRLIAVMGDYKQGDTGTGSGDHYHIQLGDGTNPYAAYNRLQVIDENGNAISLNEFRKTRKGNYSQQRKGYKHKGDDFGFQSDFGGNKAFRRLYSDPKYPIKSITQGNEQPSKTNPQAAGHYSIITYEDGVQVKIFHQNATGVSEVMSGGSAQAKGTKGSIRLNQTVYAFNYSADADSNAIGLAGNWSLGKLGKLSDGVSRRLIASILKTESSGGDQHAVEKKSGAYIGKYQLGLPWLESVGLIKKGTAKRVGKAGYAAALRDNNNWTRGSYSEFLRDAEMQDEAFKVGTDKNYQVLEKKGLLKGKSEIEIAGLLKAAHISGIGGAIAVARGKTTKADSNGTTGNKYYNDLVNNGDGLDSAHSTMESSAAVEAGNVEAAIESTESTNTEEKKKVEGSEESTAPEVTSEEVDKKASDKEFLATEIISQAHLLSQKQITQILNSGVLTDEQKAELVALHSQNPTQTQGKERLAQILSGQADFNGNISQQANSSTNSTATTSNNSTMPSEFATPESRTQYQQDSIAKVQATADIKFDDAIEDLLKEKDDLESEILFNSLDTATKAAKQKRLAEVEGLIGQDVIQQNTERKNARYEIESRNSFNNLEGYTEEESFLINEYRLRTELFNPITDANNAEKKAQIEKLEQALPLSYLEKQQAEFDEGYFDSTGEENTHAISSRTVPRSLAKQTTTAKPTAPEESPVRASVGLLGQLQQMAKMGILSQDDYDNLRVLSSVNKQHADKATIKTTRNDLLHGFTGTDKQSSFMGLVQYNEQLVPAIQNNDTNKVSQLMYNLARITTSQRNKANAINELAGMTVPKGQSAYIIPTKTKDSNGMEITQWNIRVGDPSTFTQQEKDAITQSRALPYARAMKIRGAVNEEADTLDTVHKGYEQHIANLQRQGQLQIGLKPMNANAGLNQPVATVKPSSNVETLPKGSTTTTVPGQATEPARIVTVDTRTQQPPADAEWVGTTGKGVGASNLANIVNDKNPNQIKIKEDNIGKGGWLGNPFSQFQKQAGKFYAATKEEAVQKYMDLFKLGVNNSEAFLDAVLALRGKRLSTAHYSKQEAEFLDYVINGMPEDVAKDKVKAREWVNSLAVKIQADSNGKIKAITFEPTTAIPTKVDPTPESLLAADVTSMSDITLHSGGAYGADTLWDVIGRTFSITKANHYRAEDNKKLSKKLREANVTATILSKEAIDFARNKVNELLKANFQDNIVGNLQARNYYQVVNSDGVYAIAPMHKNKQGVSGGTATAVKLGIAMGKPVYVWDTNTKQWYRHNGKTFEAVDTPILSKNPATVGTRDIELYDVRDKATGKYVPNPKYLGDDVATAAAEAIRAVFANTVSAINTSEFNIDEEQKLIDEGWELVREAKQANTKVFRKGNNFKYLKDNKVTDATESQSKQELLLIKSNEDSDIKSNILEAHKDEFNKDIKDWTKDDFSKTGIRFYSSVDVDQSTGKPVKDVDVDKENALLIPLIQKIIEDGLSKNLSVDDIVQKINHIAGKDVGLRQVGIDALITYITYQQLKKELGIANTKVESQEKVIEKTQDEIDAELDEANQSNLTIDDISWFTDGLEVVDGEVVDDLTPPDWFIEDSVALDAAEEVDLLLQEFEQSEEKVATITKRAFIETGLDSDSVYITETASEQSGDNVVNLIDDYLSDEVLHGEEQLRDTDSFTTPNKLAGKSFKDMTNSERRIVQFREQADNQGLTARIESLLYSGMSTTEVVDYLFEEYVDELGDALYSKKYLGDLLYGVIMTAGIPSRNTSKEKFEQAVEDYKQRQDNHFSEVFKELPPQVGDLTEVQKWQNNIKDKVAHAKEISSGKKIVFVGDQLGTIAVGLKTRSPSLYNWLRDLLIAELNYDIEHQAPSASIEKLPEKGDLVDPMGPKPDGLIKTESTELVKHGENEIPANLLNTETGIFDFIKAMAKIKHPKMKGDVKKVVAAIAKVMADFKPDIKIVLEPEATGLSYYDAENQVIHLRGLNYGSIDELVTRMLIQASNAEVIEQLKVLGKDDDYKLHKLNLELNGIRDDLQNILKERLADDSLPLEIKNVIYYALSDNVSLLSVALTNPTMMEFLNTLTDTRQSKRDGMLFKRIAKSVMSFFGFTQDRPTETIYERLLTASINAAEIQNKNVKNPFKESKAAMLHIMNQRTPAKLAEERAKPIKQQNKFLLSFEQRQSTALARIPALAKAIESNMLQAVNNLYHSEMDAAQEKQLKDFLYFKKEFSKFLIASYLPNNVVKNKSGEVVDYRRNDMKDYLVTRDGEGNFTIDDNTLTALSLAAYGWVLENGHKNKNTIKDIKVNLLNIKEDDNPTGFTSDMIEAYQHIGQPQAYVTEKLGRDFVRLMDIRSTKEASKHAESQLHMSVGAWILSAMQQADLIKANTMNTQQHIKNIKSVGGKVSDSVKIDDISKDSVSTFISVTDINGQNKNKRLNQISALNKGTKGFLSDIFGIDIGLRTPTLAAPNSVKLKIKGSKASITKKQEAAMAEMQKGEYKVNEDLYDVVTDLYAEDEEFLLDLLGARVTPEQLAKTHLAKRAAKENRAEGKKRDLLNAIDWISGLERTKDGFQSFWDKVYGARNSRMHYNANMFNRQSSLLHRVLAEYATDRVVIDPSKFDLNDLYEKDGLPKIEVLFIRAVAENAEGTKDLISAAIKAKNAAYEDFTVDKLSSMDYVEPFYNYMTTDADVLAAVEAMGALLDKQVLTAEQKTAIAKVVSTWDMEAQSLRALLEWTKFQRALSNSEKLTTSFILGSDGVNNGTAISAIQNGILPNINFLYQIAVIPRNAVRPEYEDIENYFDTRKYATLGDFYEDFRRLLKETIDSSEFAYDPQIQAIKRINKNLLERKTAKDALLPFGYNAGMPRIQQVVFSRFLSDLQDMMVKFATMSDEQFAEQEQKYLQFQEDLRTLLRNPHFTLPAGKDRAVLMNVWLNESQLITLEKLYSLNIGRLVRDNMFKYTGDFASRRQQITDMHSAAERMYIAAYEKVVAHAETVAKAKDPERFEEEYLTNAEWDELVVAPLEKVRASIETIFSHDQEQYDDERFGGIDLFDELGEFTKNNGVVESKTIRRGVDPKTNEPKAITRMNRLPFRIFKPVTGGLFPASASVQSVDAYVASRATIAGGKVSLNVHDSASPALDNYQAVVQEQNRSYFEALAEYHAHLESFKAIINVMEGLFSLANDGIMSEDDVYAMIEKQAIPSLFNNDKALEDMFNARADLATIMSYVLNKAKGVEQDKFNILDNFKVVHQYAGEGGQYNIGTEQLQYLKDQRESMLNSFTGLEQRISKMFGTASEFQHKPVNKALKKPYAKYHDYIFSQDQQRSLKATQYIGAGKAGTPADVYASEWGVNANTGNYTQDDIVFIHLNGGQNAEKYTSDKLIKNLVKARDAGAVLLLHPQDARSDFTHEENQFILVELLDRRYVELPYKKDDKGNDIGSGVFVPVDRVEYVSQNMQFLSPFVKVPVPKQDDTTGPLNIHSQDANGYEALSNVALRPFTLNGYQFYSVEHAYQTLKSGKFDKTTYELPNWVKGGVRNRGPERENANTEEGKKANYDLMEKLVRHSFNQNSKAKRLLMKTGDRNLTHLSPQRNKQDVTWETAFPEILMKIRDEFKGKPSTPPTSTVMTPEDIYNQLGNKTESEHVVIKPVYQRAGVAYAKSIGGVFSMRVNDMKMHFGNPYSHVPKEIAKGLIPTKDTKESVVKYIDWVINSSDERAAWIREQLKSGVLKGRKIVYYQALKDKNGNPEPSHATALDYLINKYDWNDNTSIATPPKGPQDFNKQDFSLLKTLNSIGSKDTVPANLKVIASIVYNALSKRGDTPTMTVSDEQLFLENGTEAVAWYDYQTNTIKVNRAKFDAMDTEARARLLLHESLHALTEHAIQNPTPETEQALIGLRQLANEVQANLTPEQLKTLGPVIFDLDDTGRIAELISYGLTDEYFQKILVGTKLDSSWESQLKGMRNLNGFGAFIELVKKLFNFKGKTQLDALVKLTSDLVGKSPSFIPVQSSAANQVRASLGPVNQAIASRVNAMTPMEVLKGMDKGIISDKHNALLDNMIDKFIGDFYNNTPDGNQIVNDAISNTMSRAVKAGFNLSEKEEYVNEVLMSVFKAHIAAHSGVSVINEYRKLYSEITNADNPNFFTVYDLEPNYDNLTKAEKQLVNKKVNYIKGTTVGNKQGDFLPRFIALTIASQEMYDAMNMKRERNKKAAKTLSEKILNFIGSVFEWVLGELLKTNRKNVSSQIVALTQDLRKIDIRARNRTNNKLRRVWFEGQKVTKFANSLLIGGVQKSLSKLNVSDFKSEAIRDMISIAQTYNAKDPEVLAKAMFIVANKDGQTLSEMGLIINEMLIESSIEKTAERMLRLTQLAGRYRDETRTATIKVLKESFTRDLTKAERAAVTATLLRTDVQSLLSSGHNITGLLTMVKDPAKRTAKINELKKKLAKHPNGTDMMFQAKALGAYMALGETPDNLLKNSESIAAGLGTKFEDKNYSEDLFKTVDALASLYALDFVPKKQMNILVNLLSTEEEGVISTINAHKALVAKGKEDFKGNMYNYEKGYMPHIADPRRAMKYVTSLEDMNKLKDEGWELVNDDVLPQDPSDLSNMKMMMYHPDYDYVELRSGVLDLKDTHSRGTTIYTMKDNYLDMKRVTMEKINRRNIRNKGDIDKYDPTEDSGSLIPIYNGDGSLKSYHYEMRGSTRDSLLNRNNDFFDLMGAMHGELIYRPLVKEQQGKVADMLFEDYKVNGAKNMKDFVLLDPTSIDPKVQEQWMMLPYAFRERAKELFGAGKPIPVRNLIYNTTFGYRTYTIAEMFDKVAGERNVFEKIVVGVFSILGKKYNEGRGRKYARVTEHYVQKIVKYAKETIVVRSGKVLLGNIIANMLLLLLYGVPPTDMIKGYAMAWFEGRRYTNYRAEIQELRMELAMNRSNNARKRDINNRLMQINDAIIKSPMHKYMNAGLMSTIVEDTDLSAENTVYEDALDRQLNAVAKNIPKPVKDLTNFLVMSKGTTVYEVLADMTQYSDFGAKYILAKHLQEQNGMSFDEAVSVAQTNFINFDIPMGRGIDYLDRLGILMFIKFLLRIQKVMVHKLKKQPVTSIAQHLLVENVFNTQGFYDPFLPMRMGLNSPFSASAFIALDVEDQMLTMNVIGGLFD